MGEKMKVSFNLVDKYKTKVANIKSKSKKESESDVYVPPTRNQILSAKTKKTVSECFWIVLGCSALYFLGKKKSKDIRIAKEAAEALKRKQMTKEKILKSKEFENFIPVAILPR